MYDLRKLASVGLLVFTIVASANANERGPMISCKVLDTGNFLPEDFEAQLCRKLASALGYRVQTFTDNTSRNDGDLNLNAIVLDIETVSKKQAFFKVYFTEQGQIDPSAEPTRGPFLVETMDADLEAALPSHLQNHLKRLLKR